MDHNLVRTVCPKKYEKKSNYKAPFIPVACPGDQFAGYIDVIFMDHNLVRTICPVKYENKSIYKVP